MATDTPFPRSLLGTWLARWSWRRVGITLLAGGIGAGVGYGASWLLTLATCTNGGCPTATEPVPFVALVAIAAAWAAGTGARSS